MKIISLNTFAGTLFDPLMAFIDQHQADTDVFCFQEIFTTNQPDFITTKIGKRANLLHELTQRLPDFQVFYSVAQDGVLESQDVTSGLQLGLTIFVRKGLEIKDSGDFFIYKSRNSYVHPDFLTFPYNALYVGLSINDQPLTICCLHGASQPGDKLDTPDRLAQSQKVIDLLGSRPGEKIVMGDFNLRPETESIRMFEPAGYRNLIGEFEITTTRGTMHKQLNPKYANTPEGYQEYADYTFVTPGIKVTSFEVPDVPISDHLPMILEIK
jgi:endonuclease/exonuclease/phosphatase family metal-dependent hydrolase